MLLTRHEIELCDRIFTRWGGWATFVGRLLPGVRTYIALPAGVSSMPLLPFVVASAVGSFLWSIPLVYAGQVFGENIEVVKPWLHRFEIVIVVVGVAIIGTFLWHRIRTLRREARTHTP